MAAFEAPPHSGGLKYAKQAEFDYLVNEMVEEGTRLEEAVSDVLEILVGEGQSTSSLYIYTTTAQLESKKKLQAQCGTIEKRSKNTETSVNCLFAYQGLKATLEKEIDNSSSGKDSDVMSWRFIEGRNIIKTLVRNLTVGEDENSDDENEDNIDAEEDSDSDVDEDEDRAMFIIDTIDMLNFIAVQGIQLNLLLKPEPTFTLDEDLMIIIHDRLDKMLSDVRVVRQTLAFLLVLCGTAANVALLKEVKGKELLEIVGKYHKNDNTVTESVAVLLQTILTTV